MIDSSVRESFKTRILRWTFNCFPAYRRTGGRITFIADDFSCIRVKVPLNWQTRNYVGTIFGGSMYGAVDPIYMIMFIKLLGPEYIVWDKSGIIQHKKPGKSTLRAEFTIDPEEVESIRDELETAEKINRTYQVVLLSDDGSICTLVEKTLHFSKRKLPEAPSK